MFTRIYLFFKYLAFKRKAIKKARTGGVCRTVCLENEIKRLRVRNSEYYLKNQELELIIHELRKELDSVKYMYTNPEQKRIYSRIGTQTAKQAS